MKMGRPTILIVEPEPNEALSARKLVVETAKFNVTTAYSERSQAVAGKVSAPRRDRDDCRNAWV